MILDKFVEVTIINHNINHYKKLGYNVKCKNKIIVKPEELSSGSHYRLNCACDECENKTNVKYQDYMIVFNKNGKYICKKCNDKKFLKLLKENRKKSLNEKYNVDNVFQLEFVKEKMKQTFIEKYGFDCPQKNSIYQEILKQKRIENGTQIPDDKLSKYELFKKKVLFFTRKYKEQLYNDWDGFDYYDNELIIENKNLHFNSVYYPTIDHKISIKMGFINNIDPIIIGSINNLCITKRINNMSKGSLYDIPKRLMIK